jgi:iron(III) transport system ATP-binding protein
MNPAQTNRDGRATLPGPRTCGWSAMESAQEHAPHLTVQNVSKQFGAFTALQQLSFSVRRGEFICVLGPSGCGKTTLLRIIAGLEAQTKGSVRIAGRDVSSLPVSRRNVGIVFQSYALFPNLTAAQNIAYGLKQQRTQKQQIRRQVEELLELVGLAGMGPKYPAQLSGGQQQRVALARAMALSPELLLLDEPLSALDAQVRAMLRAEIRQLQQRLKVTTLMVTHDQEEALTMADRILVMEKGALVQNGTPLDVYDRPATPFVAAFIGSMNFLRNAVKEGDAVYRIGGCRLKVAGENGSRHLAVGNTATIAIRPEDIMIWADRRELPNTVLTRVQQLEYRGPLFRLALKLQACGEDAAVIEADVPSEKIRRLNINPAMVLSVQLPMDRLRVYAA